MPAPALCRFAFCSVLLAGRIPAWINRLTDSGALVWDRALQAQRSYDALVAPKASCPAPAPAPAASEDKGKGEGKEERRADAADAGGYAAAAGTGLRRQHGAQLRRECDGDGDELQDRPVARLREQDKEKEPHGEATGTANTPCEGLRQGAQLLPPWAITCGGGGGELVPGAIASPSQLGYAAHRHDTSPGDTAARHSCDDEATHPASRLRVEAERRQQWAGAQAQAGAGAEAGAAVRCTSPAQRRPRGKLPPLHSPSP